MTRPGTPLLAGVTVLVLALVVLGVVLVSDGDDGPGSLEVTWASSELIPSCAYDAAAGTVTARLTVTGRVPEPVEVTANVGAFADENTSDEVGSGSRTVTVDGKVDEVLEVTFPVARRPHRGEDGDTACKLAVSTDPQVR